MGFEERYIHQCLLNCFDDDMCRLRLRLAGDHQYINLHLLCGAFYYSIAA